MIILVPNPVSFYFSINGLPFLNTPNILLNLKCRSCKLSSCGPPLGTFVEVSFTICFSIMHGGQFSLTPVKVSRTLLMPKSGVSYLVHWKKINKGYISTTIPFKTSLVGQSLSDEGFFLCHDVNIWPHSCWNTLDWCLTTNRRYHRGNSECTLCARSAALPKVQLLHRENPNSGICRTWVNPLPNCMSVWFKNRWYMQVPVSDKCEHCLQLQLGLLSQSCDPRQCILIARRGTADGSAIFNPCHFKPHCINSALHYFTHFKAPTIRPLLFFLAQSQMCFVTSRRPCIPWPPACLLLHMNPLFSYISRVSFANQVTWCM